ncbi:nucleotidyl transferase AbiEii/AbiGii toxin family protein [Candidatus Uhrbacteria bacterium]|nr:nucleotidyl transferase AbiEii/AbiGii toxin family protein [Candidatus Uhrbacteria bacterium]
MEKTILTNAQRVVLRGVAQNENLGNFYLSGGTALAEYYLHHRLSEDLDFFSREKFDPIFLHSWVEEMRTTLECERVTFNRIADRYQFVFHLEGEDLKVEFVHYAFDNLYALVDHDGIRVNSLRDIAANKLVALLDRFEPKDFVDLYFLMRQISFDDIKADMAQKFGMPIDPIFLGTELLKARRIAALPRMIKPLTVEDLKRFFMDQARIIGGVIISEPSAKGLPGHF